MNIGDKVRFLNDVGGGKITAFRPGGIVMVEDEDGFEVPMPQHEVVVIEEKPKKMVKPEPKKAAKVERFEEKVERFEPKTVRTEAKKVEKPETPTFNGREYLQSKTVASAEPEQEVDEQLEARVVRLELTLQQQEQAIQQMTQTIQRMEEALQKAEERITRLEAENNLRKNEKMMARQAKPKAKPKPEMPKTIEDLQIL